MQKLNSFSAGVRDGVSIGLGYLSVSFAFGIMGVGSGLSILEVVMVSMMNVTSAGQLAALPILASLGSVIELILTQVVINARYALMSISLSQRLAPDVGTKERMLVGFVNTDEVFAVATGKGMMLGKMYLFGLIIPPFIGWTMGTLLGAVLGNVLPVILTNALGIALYAMFIAIVIPEGRSDRRTAFCILVSAALSCAFFFVPILKRIPSGFTVIIIAVAVSAFFAALYPIKEEEVTGDA
ncbi:MAG: AzlC family ABC transporter permease [Clostridia bacterium]|nr:AzlC family ABC transporter permease [Clostridia bacterium]